MKTILLILSLISTANATSGFQLNTSSVTVVGDIAISANTYFPSGIWNTSGNVGVGTTNPGAKLDVNGDILLSASNAAIRTGTADGADSALRFLTGGGAASSSRGSDIIVSGNESALTGSLYIDAGNVSGGNIIMRTGADVERMTILNNGNVGVGTTNPTSALYVVGNVSADSFTDRTPYPDTKQQAYDSVNSMEKKASGGVDHVKLNPFIRREVKESHYDKVAKSTTTTTTYERDISATLSAQNEVIKDLIKRINELEKK